MMPTIHRVYCVFAICAPFKVFNAVVRSVEIFVIDLRLALRIGDEGVCHKTMHAVCSPRESHLHIPRLHVSVELSRSPSYRLLVCASMIMDGYDTVDAPNVS